MEELKKLFAFTGIDVEKLVDDYTATLNNNGWRNATKEASIIALKEYVQKKEWLIRQVMGMPGYNGNLQSVVSVEVPMVRKAERIYSSVDSIWRNLFERGDKLLSKTNKDGKTMTDVIAEELADMPSMIDVAQLSKFSGKKIKSYSDFDYRGYTKDSLKLKNKACEAFDIFHYLTSPKLTKGDADRLNAYFPRLGAAEGMKTTRALGKIIKICGLEDKTAGSKYGKYFISDYCELMRDGMIRMMFVISVNPIDYLTMSFGTDWESCHNIRKGGWKSGCISYMLDEVTMITYALKPNTSTDPDPNTGEVILGKDRPELFRKVFRNVFHWDRHNRLIQSRVYPQGNEGCVDLYKVFRNAVQKELSAVNGWDSDNWTKRDRKFTSFTRAGEGATNYADWSYSGFGGNLSTPGHLNDPYDNESIMYIGAKPTCVMCGEKHTSSGTLGCHRHRY